jgi:hypothetical protein
LRFATISRFAKWVSQMVAFRKWANNCKCRNG